MARPLRIAFPGAFYHVTARGNERKAVFCKAKKRELVTGRVPHPIQKTGFSNRYECPAVKNIGKPRQQAGENRMHGLMREGWPKQPRHG